LLAVVFISLVQIRAHRNEGMSKLVMTLHGLEEAQRSDIVRWITSFYTAKFRLA